MISSKNGRTRATLGDFRRAPELGFSTDRGSSLHSPVPLLDATRLKVLLDACRRYRETPARRLFRQRSRQRENGQTASTHDHIVESRRGKCGKKHRFKSNRHQHPTSRARVLSDIGDRSLILGGGSVVTTMLNARNDARNEGGTYQRVEVITGRRRRWTAEEKARIVAESLEANANISEVARRHGVARGLLTAWRRQLSSDGSSQEPQQSFAAVKIDTVASVSNDIPRYSTEPDAVATALPAVTGRGRIEIDVAGARIRVENGV
jgi:transposase